MFKQIIPTRKYEVAYKRLNPSGLKGRSLEKVINVEGNGSSGKNSPKTSSATLSNTASEL